MARAHVVARLFSVTQWIPPSCAMLEIRLGDMFKPTVAT